jgi:hypothetical protein
MNKFEVVLYLNSQRNKSTVIIHQTFNQKNRGTRATFINLYIVELYCIFWAKAASELHKAQSLRAAEEKVKDDLDSTRAFFCLSASCFS